MRQQQHAHEPTYLWASAVPPRVFHAKFRGANDNEPTDALSLYPGLICGASQFRDISRVPRRSACEREGSRRVARVSSSFFSRLRVARARGSRRFHYARRAQSFVCERSTQVAVVVVVVVFSTPLCCCCCSSLWFARFGPRVLQVLSPSAAACCCFLIFIIVCDKQGDTIE